jgi:hypothetical protein
VELSTPLPLLSSVLERWPQGSFHLQINRRGMQEAIILTSIIDISFIVAVISNSSLAEARSGRQVEEL